VKNKRGLKNMEILNENKKLFQIAVSAIHELFFDISVDKEKAVENLEALKKEIDFMLNSMED
jgi:hypothetical protein